MGTGIHELEVLLSGPRKRPASKRFSPEQSFVTPDAGRAGALKVRLALMRRLACYIQRRGLTVAEAAVHFDVAPPRMSDLLTGRVGRFTAGDLVNICIRGGLPVDVRFGDAA
jgi:predicted XRE-type DNA-binding protein